MVSLDTIDLLLETKFGNKYVLMAIDRYSKWCVAKPMKEHNMIIVAKFQEEEIICKFGVSKYVFTSNGGEWMVEFDMFCKIFGITHQFTHLNGHSVTLY
jgi:hypothetical protein